MPEQEQGEGLSRPDWLVLLIPDGTVAGVEGGAPTSWISRTVDTCPGMPEKVREAARSLLADHSQPLRRTCTRAVRMAPAVAGEPAFTVVAIEAIPLRPEEVALGPLLLATLQPLLPQAERSGASLSLECAPDLPRWVALDPEKIGWTIATLVGSALRYVPGGTVVVRATHSARERVLRISVRDDGPGIPRSAQRWLVSPNPETGRPTGVALRMVHEVARAHGGGMVLKSSTEPGQQGTEITLCLPTDGSMAAPRRSDAVGSFGDGCPMPGSAEIPEASTPIPDGPWRFGSQPNFPR
jgi:hypothetical protein